MKNEKTQAIVLRRTNYGEADRIVTFLTPAGKISALARGARRQKSKLAGGIEVFSVNEILLAKGKSDLRTLISARMKDFFAEIIKDFDRTEFAYRAIKIINARSEMIDSPDFFRILKEALVSLNSPKINLRLIKAWFFLNLEDICGDEVNLEIDREGDLLSPKNQYSFDEYDRVFFVDQNGKFSQDHIKFLRLMRASSPAILSKVKNYPKLLDEIDRVIEVLSGK